MATSIKTTDSENLLIFSSQVFLFGYITATIINCLRNIYHDLPVDNRIRNRSPFERQKLYIFLATATISTIAVLIYKIDWLLSLPKDQASIKRATVPIEAWYMVYIKSFICGGKCSCPVPSLCFLESWLKAMQPLKQYFDACRQSRSSLLLITQNLLGISIWSMYAGIEGKKNPWRICFC